MFWIDEFVNLYTPWIVLIGMIFTFIQLYRWARNKKTGAFIFGMMMQMMLPDPYAERTIKVVQEQKQSSKKSVDENGEPLS